MKAKRLISILLVLVIVGSFASCRKNPKSDGGSDYDSDYSSDWYEDDENTDGESDDSQNGTDSSGNKGGTNGGSSLTEMLGIIHTGAAENPVQSIDEVKMNNNCMYCEI